MTDRRLKSWGLSGIRRRSAAARRTPLVFRALLAALGAWALLAGAAGAAEFTVPPGQNVGMQEDLLRERITRIAKDQIGDKLISVVANVAYLKLSTVAGSAGERIKLPGLNNFITTSGDVQVTPEYVRLRQVVVVVSDELAAQTATLERDIRTQAELDPGKGDRLEVVTAASAVARRPKGIQPGTKAGAGAEGEDLAVGKEKKPEAPPTPEADALREPKSTGYLINARAAYFRGDFNGALDQIMQSISAKPDNPQAYAMLGSLYYAMNWKNLALKYWEKALAQDPTNRDLEQLVTQLRTAQN